MPRYDSDKMAREDLKGLGLDGRVVRVLATCPQVARRSL
jgi:hypothetical protein